MGPADIHGRVENAFNEGDADGLASIHRSEGVIDAG
jgi:hypothetical protein